MVDREIKQQIRKLRKLKRDTQIKTEGRRQINKQIRDLTDSLTSVVSTTPKIIESPARIALIEAVYTCNPSLKRRGIDLTKYTDEQLNLHLNKRKRRLL